MKKTILLLTAILFGFVISAQDEVKKAEPVVDVKQVKKEGPVVNTQEVQEPEVEESLDGPKMSFENKVVDYGKIEHNADGNREFVFTNSGTEPLIIKNAKGSCGCTVPTWPREPIMPGASDKIKVKYATNRVGKFTKTITISTNSADKKPVILTIKGEVLPPPKYAAAPEKNTEGAPLENK